MNILIVESENDQYFVQALINHLNLQEKVKVDAPISTEFERLGGIQEDGTNLIIKLKDIKTEIFKRGIEKIGIILDIDKKQMTERIQLVNNSLKKVFGEETSTLSSVNEFITIQLDEELSVKIACYFTNVDGKGELEDLLKAIAKADSSFADCLQEGWVKCAESKGKKIEGKEGNTTGVDISQKELTKLWVDFYKRYDTLKRKERNKETTEFSPIFLGLAKEDKKTGKLKHISERGSKIFDYDAAILTEIRNFLNLFR